MPQRSNPVSQWHEPPQGGASVSIVAGFLYTVAPGDYRLTTDSATGTHGFNSASGTLSIVLRADLDGTAYIFARPDGTFLVLES